MASGTRRGHRIGVLAALPILAFLGWVYYRTDPQSGGFPTCPFFELTGLYCTGCGSQRAFHDLLHLDWVGALGHNLLFVPTLILVGWHGLAFGFPKQLNSPLAARFAPQVLLVVIGVFTILRNLPWGPGPWLAP